VGGKRPKMEARREKIQEGFRCGRMKCKKKEVGLVNPRKPIARGKITSRGKQGIEKFQQPEGRKVDCKK